MHPVAFAAREYAYLFLLIGAVKVKFGNVRPRVKWFITYQNGFLAAGTIFPNRFIGIKVIMQLIDISKSNSFSNTECSRIGLILAGDQPEKRGFAGAVRADDTDNSCGW